MANSYHTKEKAISLQIKKSNVWDDVAKSYHSWSISNRWFYFLLGLEIKKSVRSAEYILDVGSGPGILAEELKILFPESKIICVDTSFEMCRFSRGIRCEASSLPFKHSIFDLITFCFSLHELKIDSALEEASRVLKNGGVVYIVDLNKDAPEIIKRNLRLLLEKIISKEYAEHLEESWNAFESCEEIAEKLKKRGFGVECTKGLQEIRILAKKI